MLGQVAMAVCSLRQPNAASELPRVGHPSEPDGTVIPATAYDLGPASDRTYPGNLVDLDLDGDGDLDVVISNDNPDAKRIFFNDGKGRFHEVGSYGRAEWSTRKRRRRGHQRRCHARHRRLSMTGTR